METVICEYCGKELPKAEATEYGDIYLCPDCADEYLTTCDRCGDKVSYDDSYSTPYGRLCECCHGDLYG